MHKFWKLIKKHYLAIILALVVGSLTALPQVYAIYKFDNFQGIYTTVNNDETYYMARARDIVDGHSFLSNPFLYEYKNGLPMQFWLPDYILAKPLAILGVDIHRGYIFYDFLLPAILTLLTYSILYLLIGLRSLSFLGATWLHLSLFLFIFNRAPSPQLNFIFWLLLFLFWLKFLKQQKAIYAVAMGIIFGLLFHLYPYYWTFYVIFFAFFLLASFIFKQEVDYKKYFLMAVIALIIATPYFISLIQCMQLPYYNESLARVGMLDTHFPSGKKIVIWAGVILILLFFAYRKKIIALNQYTLLLSAGVLATIVAVNQHVITGKNLQFSSHYWMLSEYCFVFSAFYILGGWIKKKDKSLLKLVILFLLAIYIFYTPFLYLQNILKGKTVSYRPADIARQNYAPIFAWLDKNTSPDEVVFANQELSYLVSIYTFDNVFYISSTVLHFMPNSEIWQRFILNNYWEDFTKEFIVKNEFCIWGSYYKTEYGHNLSKNKIRKLFFLPPMPYEKIPPAEIENILKLAREIQGQDFEQQLKKYKVDYFIWDKNKDPHWQVDKLNFLQPVYEQKDIGIIIYKVK